MLMFFFAAVFAFINRARGSRFGDLLNSTVLTRVLATAIASSLCAGITGNVIILPVIWAGLMLWCSPAWNNYWSAAIGNPTNVNAKAFIPVDWIMSKLPGFDKLYSKIGLSPDSMMLRLWGTIAMGLRGLLIYPTFAALGFLGYDSAFLIGFAAIFQGVPYLIGGIPKSKGYSITFAEYAWGVCLGLMFYFSLSLS